MPQPIAPQAAALAHSSPLHQRPAACALALQGIKLFLVSIGTHARSKDFVEVTGFPAENLFAGACVLVCVPVCY